MWLLKTGNQCICAFLVGPHPINGICHTASFPFHGTRLCMTSWLHVWNPPSELWASPNNPWDCPHAFFWDFSGEPCLCTAALFAGGAMPKHVPVCVLALLLTSLLLERMIRDELVKPTAYTTRLLSVPPYHPLNVLTAMVVSSEYFKSSGLVSVH